MLTTLRLYEPLIMYHVLISVIQAGSGMVYLDTFAAHQGMDVFERVNRAEVVGEEMMLAQTKWVWLVRGKETQRCLPMGNALHHMSSLCLTSLLMSLLILFFVVIYILIQVA